MLITQVRLFEHHKSPVSDLAFDAAGEYLASCSGDGSVTTCSLYSDTVIKYDYSQPVQVSETYSIEHALVYTNSYHVAPA
jgi:WD40 repeat protein